MKMLMQFFAILLFSLPYFSYGIELHGIEKTNAKLPPKPATEVNTPNEIPAPRSSYPVLYTLNAGSAKLIKLSNDHFQLILRHVHDQVNYSIHETMASGTWPLQQFISLWKINKNIRGDVTGLQRNKTEGHTQFYASFLLDDVKYNSQLQELSFQVTSQDSVIRMTKTTYFYNVTVYVNGCDFQNVHGSKVYCK